MNSTSQKSTNCGGVPAQLQNDDLMWHVGWRLYCYLLILLFDGLARRRVSTYVAIAAIFSFVLFPNCMGLKRQKALEAVRDISSFWQGVKFDFYINEWNNEIGKKL